jgi:acetyltransferase-like isoleucine patch superfamily enzyme
LRRAFGELENEMNRPRFKMLAWFHSAVEFAPKLAYFARGAYLAFLIRSAGGSCGSGLRVDANVRFRHRPHSGLKFGKRIYIGACSIIDCPPGATLEIGDNATFTHGVFISSLSHVHIGANALIGEYVSIRDANHSFAERDRPINQQPMLGEGVLIGEDCWISRGCAVLAGANVGPGSIIGANSVVKGVLADHAIWVGAPAKKIRDRFNSGEALD